MEIWQMSATALVAAVADRTVSVRDVVDAAIARIEALDHDIKAWITLDTEGARRRASELDRQVVEGRPLGILGGLPVGVKDVFYTAGLPTTASSRVLADFVPSDDAPAVAALRRADAVILGKVHTAEFANGDPAVTRNPWNLEHTPGGSSSGSAAAVAAGMAGAALGSQTGGSTLRPAAYNGIVGFKPTYGTISTEGTIPLAWSFDHVGILARSVADVEVVRQALVSGDSRAKNGAREPALFESARSPRIGLARSNLFETSSPEVRSDVAAAAERFARSGAEVVEVVLPEVFSAIRSAYATIASAETATYHERMFADRERLYRPKIANRIRQGLAGRAVDYVRALRERGALVAELERSLDAVDVLLTPATPASAPRDLTTTGDPSYIMPWSFTGLPTICVPSGMSAEGLPLGVQLVGHRGQDARLLEAAAWCEGVLDLDLHPPCWSDAAAFV